MPSPAPRPAEPPAPAPAVSVILPTYNRSASLAAAARSVLDQSYRDLELLLVDDASAEDIPAVAETLDDPRARYFRHDRNRGASAARNTGLAQARGRFIAFQDSDDLWLPDKLARQMALLEGLPEEVGVVIGAKILYGADAARNYGKGKVTYAPAAGRWLTLEEDQIRRFLLENRISLQNALFRRACFPGTVWFDPCAKANADWEFTIRLVQHTKVYEDPDPVVFSYISTDSISRNPRKKAMGLTRILKKNRAVYERYPNEYGIFLYSLGIALHRVGRRRAARRYLLRSVRTRPRNLLTVAERLATKGGRGLLGLLPGRGRLRGAP